MSEQLALALDTPGLDPVIVAGLKRHGWRLVKSALVDQEPRYWFANRELRQMCGPGQFLPHPPLCKTMGGAQAMLERLEREQR